jgi:oligoendopeptidase F
MVADNLLGKEPRMTQTLPPRSAIAKEHTWDTESLFPSEADWEAAFQRQMERLPALERFHGHLGDSPALLADWLQTADELVSVGGKITVYADMFHEVDTADPAGAARHSRVMGLWARTSAALAFARPEILAIPTETLQRWMQEEPRLAVYAHYFDQLEKRKAHVRSAEVEELLGQVAEPFATSRMIHGILSDADLTFRPARDSDGNEIAIGQGNISALLTSPDRETRRTAWEHYADSYLATKNTTATCIASGVQQNVFLARAHRYGSALEAACAAGDIPTDVFHNLIATFRKHLPVWHRYWNLRRRALKLDKLHVYDVKAPLTGEMPKVPFSQSVAWISDGMKPLGDEYVRAMRRGLLEQRWVDIYPNQGKRMGAFSSGVQGTHPFILMSYSDDVFSVSTLAHELGHSMHSYYAWQTQPPIYADYSIFVAEVASNFNQALVRAYLLNTNPDPNFQIALIEEAMSNFHRYFFIMPTLARFELEIHARVERGEALTADSLMTLMADLFQEGYNEDVAVDRERVGITWAQFPTHLYSNFYVYQYATGISGAHALAEGILAGGPGAAERYLDFLRAGGSVYPLDALKKAGVDLTTPEPVEQTYAVLARMLDRLEQLLGLA